MSDPLHALVLNPDVQLPGSPCTTRSIVSGSTSRGAVQPHCQQVMLLKPTNLLRARRLSCALVAGVDEGVGLLKERLARAGILDDTVTEINNFRVVVIPILSDHCLLFG